MGFIRKKRYNGCELSSPLYRQIVAENAKKKSKIKVIEEHKKSLDKKMTILIGLWILDKLVMLGFFLLFN